jgi:hypothetical protein
VTVLLLEITIITGTFIYVCLTYSSHCAMHLVFPTTLEGIRSIFHMGTPDGSELPTLSPVRTRQDLMYNGFVPQSICKESIKVFPSLGYYGAPNVTISSDFLSVSNVFQSLSILRDLSNWQGISGESSGMRQSHLGQGGWASFGWYLLFPWLAMRPGDGQKVTKGVLERRRPKQRQARRVQPSDLDNKIFRTLHPVHSGSWKLPLLQLGSQMPWSVKQIQQVLLAIRDGGGKQCSVKSSVSSRHQQWKCLF